MKAGVPQSIRKRSDLVADQIKEAIISKKLPPGERLSDEKDFLKTYRVSKGTMREALKSLEVQGLVNIKTGPGGGASVARVSAEKTNELLWNYFFSRNVSLEDIYAVRKLVEPELAASVAEHLDVEDLQLLELWSLIANDPNFDVARLAPFPDWMRQELIGLDYASSFVDAQERLHRIHRHIAAQAFVLPLWEVDEFAAFRSNVSGVPEELMSVYHNAERWIIRP